MTDEHDRLRQARIKAGYETAHDACVAFGWKYPTYSSHENGSRGISARAASRYARALGITEEWLLFGRSASVQKTAPGSGFAEPAAAGPITKAVVAFVAQTAREASTIERAARALIPSAKKMFLYSLQRSYIDFGLLKGDIVIADLAQQPRYGQIVIANRIDEDTGNGETTLCRYYHGGLMSSIGDPGQVIDMQHTSVLATIQGSFRIGA